MKFRIYAALAVKGLKVAERLRRWATNKQPLSERLVLAGLGISAMIGHKLTNHNESAKNKCNTKHGCVIG